MKTHMRILITTIGSRGDVQPYVALGRGLRAAGHEVVICAASDYRAFIEEHGIAYAHMNSDLLRLMDSELGRDVMENTTGPLRWMRAAIALSKRTGPIELRNLQDGWEAAQATRPDLILFHPKAYGGPHFARELGIPCMLATPIPLYVPTGEFPAFGFPGGSRSAWYNRLTYKLIHLATASATGRYIKKWRRESGLDPAKDFQPLRGVGRATPAIHGISPHVLPRPSDWPANAVAMGYWFLNESESSWKAPMELKRFLEAGPPPVYIGFGSISGSNPEGKARIVMEALRLAKARGVIAAGWGGLKAKGDLPADIFLMEQAPHDWLFPRMAAVVHHGGAGTTAAGLRAGRPTIVCPFFGDQPAWGRRVWELGAGAKPIPQKKLTAEKLAAAIRLVLEDRGIRARAEEIGSGIREEDGVARAIDFIESKYAELKLTARS